MVFLSRIRITSDITPTVINISEILKTGKLKAFISKKSYERYENGLRVLPSDILIIFCKYYNVSADYVLGLIPNFRKLH